MTTEEIQHHLIPTRRGPTDWYRSWRVRGLEEAVASAEEFYAAEGVPVLVCEGRRTGPHRLFTIPTQPTRRRR